jgi:hypothetical protein
MKYFILIFLLIILAVIEHFGYSQYMLYKEMEANNETISCGGDFSYFVKCPEGTYCKSLDKGPFVGGECSVYLKDIFDTYLK